VTIGGTPSNTKVLTRDKVGFAPTPDGQVELTVPTAFDWMVAPVFPEFGWLIGCGTSPAGIQKRWNVKVYGKAA
jgi:hypothetical protein